MKNVSIFEGGFVTYPTIFKPRVKSADVTKLITKKFILSPVLSRVGSVKNLTLNIGEAVGDARTLQTPFISGSASTSYNGYDLKLVVKDDKIKLSVSEDKKILLLDCWEIAELTKSLSVRNQKCDFIDNDFVKNLITSGQLKVKFNVSKLKNHGTLWKIS